MPDWLAFVSMMGPCLAQNAPGFGPTDSGPLCVADGGQPPSHLVHGNFGPLSLSSTIGDLLHPLFQDFLAISRRWEWSKCLVKDAPLLRLQRPGAFWLVPWIPERVF